MMIFNNIHSHATATNYMNGFRMWVKTVENMDGSHWIFGEQFNLILNRLQASIKKRCNMQGIAVAEGHLPFSDDDIDKITKTIYKYSCPKFNELDVMTKLAIQYSGRVSEMAAVKISHFTITKIRNINGQRQYIALDNFRIKNAVQQREVNAMPHRTNVTECFYFALARYLMLSENLVDHLARHQNDLSDAALAQTYLCPTYGMKHYSDLQREKKKEAKANLVPKFYNDTLKELMQKVDGVVTKKLTSHSGKKRAANLLHDDILLPTTWTSIRCAWQNPSSLKNTQGTIGYYIQPNTKHDVAASAVLNGWNCGSFSHFDGCSVPTLESLKNDSRYVEAIDRFASFMFPAIIRKVFNNDDLLDLLLANVLRFLDEYTNLSEVNEDTDALLIRIKAGAQYAGISISDFHDMQMLVKNDFVAKNFHKLPISVVNNTHRHSEPHQPDTRSFVDELHSVRSDVMNHRIFLEHQLNTVLKELREVKSLLSSLPAQAQPPSATTTATTTTLCYTPETAYEMLPSSCTMSIRAGFTQYWKYDYEKLYIEAKPHLVNLPKGQKSKMSNVMSKLRHSAYFLVLVMGELPPTDIHALDAYAIAAIQSATGYLQSKNVSLKKDLLSITVNEFRKLIRDVAIPEPPHDAPEKMTNFYDRLTSRKAQ